MKTTTKAQHSPAPWRRDNAHDHAACSIVGADGKLVVAGEGDGWMAPFACRPQAEAEANLRLVEAAPDLLAACVKVYHELDGVGGAEASNYVGHLRAALRAAIARAEGNA